MDCWRPGRDIGVRHLSDDIANHSNQVRETAGKFYVLWRGQAVYAADKQIRALGVTGTVAHQIAQMTPEERARDALELAERVRRRLAEYRMTIEHEPKE